MGNLYLTKKEESWVRTMLFNYEPVGELDDFGKPIYDKEDTEFKLKLLSKLGL